MERDFKRTFHPMKCANERHSSLLITANVMKRFHFHLLGVTACRLFMKGSNLDFFFMGSINSDIFTAIESIPLMFTVIINASIILVICVDIFYLPVSIKTFLYLFLHRNFVKFMSPGPYLVFSLFLAVCHQVI